jgi:hypothetical protein
MATKKPATPTDEKFTNVDFDLFKALDAIDRKDYDYYNQLTEEQQKKFVPFMMTKWASSVKANGDIGRYYVMSVNENANKHLFDERIQKHPELQWLMLCAASPGIGKQYHQYIYQLSNKVVSLQERAATKDYFDFFKKVYPNSQESDVKQLAQEYTNIQQHQHRLAEKFPAMKLADIELLSKLTTTEEIDEHDRDSGIQV